MAEPIDELPIKDVNSLVDFDNESSLDNAAYRY